MDKSPPIKDDDVDVMDFFGDSVDESATLEDELKDVSEDVVVNDAEISEDEIADEARPGKKVISRVNTDNDGWMFVEDFYSETEPGSDEWEHTASIKTNECLHGKGFLLTMSAKHQGKYKDGIEIFNSAYDGYSAFGEFAEARKDYSDYAKWYETDGKLLTDDMYNHIVQNLLTTPSKLLIPDYSHSKVLSERVAAAQLNQTGINTSMLNDKFMEIMGYTAIHHQDGVVTYKKDPEYALDKLFDVYVDAFVLAIDLQILSHDLKEMADNINAEAIQEETEQAFGQHFPEFQTKSVTYVIDEMSKYLDDLIKGNSDKFVLHDTLMREKFANKFHTKLNKILETLPPELTNGATTFQGIVAPIHYFVGPLCTDLMTGKIASKYTIGSTVDVACIIGMLMSKYFINRTNIAKVQKSTPTTPEARQEHVSGIMAGLMLVKTMHAFRVFSVNPNQINMEIARYKTADGREFVRKNLEEIEQVPSEEITDELIDARVETQIAILKSNLNYFISGEGNAENRNSALLAMHRLLDKLIPRIFGYGDVELPEDFNVVAYLGLDVAPFLYTPPVEEKTIVEESSDDTPETPEVEE